MFNLPRSTQAAILLEQRKPLEIADILLPDVLEPGQVLVEIAYSGICGSQIGEIDGAKGPDKWLPHLLGHEASGTVLAIGAAVKYVSPGDRVVAHWRPSLGIEASTPKYNWNGQVVNSGLVTTFSKYSVISENRLTPIPPTSDLKTAALYGCAITTGFGTIDNVAKVRLGESVVVFGSGGVGLNIVQASALAGARLIVAVDLHRSRLELAKKCGATHLIDAGELNPWEVLKSIFGGDSPDVFIDNTGSPEVISLGYELVHSTGRVVLVGVPKKGDSAHFFTLPLHFGKSIIGTAGGESLPHVDIARYMALVEQRKLELNELISEVAPLSKINNLIEGMRSGLISGRCLVSFVS